MFGQTSVPSKEALERTVLGPSAYPTDRYKKDMVEPYRSSKDMTQMVWGGFSRNKRWPLLPMERDYREEDGEQKDGYSARSYMWILEQVIPEFYDPHTPFMQDNAPIHRARVLQEWFERNGVWVIEWPPYSPDLNPIENLWAILKARVFERHPYLGPGHSAKDLQELIEAVQETWESIEDEVLENLADSMDRRIQAIITAEGWYTKY